MKRFQDWGLVDMAHGDPRPLWPLYGVTPRFAEWSFGTARPFNCKDDCTRWHAGIDLVRAPDKTVVLATEKMEIVGVDRGWSKGSKAVTGRTPTGLFLVYGGTIRGSGDEFEIKEGMTVDKGAPIGRVKGSYGMIHFETYRDDNRSRMSNSQWPIGQQPPTGLENPLNYIQRAAGVPETIANWHQRREALRALGYGPADTGPWGELDTDALVEAQAGLNETYGEDLDVDGVWGPNTDKVIRKYLAQVDKSTDSPGLPPNSTSPRVPDLRAPGIMLGSAAATIFAYAILRRAL